MSQKPEKSGVITNKFVFQLLQKGANYSLNLCSDNSCKIPEFFSPNDFTNESLHLSAYSASYKLLTGNDSSRGF